MNQKQEPTEKIGKKPVFYNEAKTIINLKSHFQEKMLCDGPTFSTGAACVFSCAFCYVESGLIRTAQTRQIREAGLKFEDTVIRRKNPIEVLRGQLFDKKGQPKFPDPNDTRVIYASPLVDVAATRPLVDETVEVCKLILEHTHWQIRLLSKSRLLHELAGQIPEQWKERMIYGLSIGTLDDKLASAFERGATIPSKRLEALHKLQDDGYRTFGMICPSLPQPDYDKFAREMADAIRVERCEHVWAEVINLRGKSLTRTIESLWMGGLNHEADLLTGVKTGDRWEEYARDTFLAHTRHIPAGKLRFMQYVKASNREWWEQHRDKGAVLLGKAAEESNSETALTSAQEMRFKDLDKTVAKAARAFVEAGHALYQIRSEKLYRAKFGTFEDYCQSVHDISRQYANNLIRAGKTYSNMETFVSKNRTELVTELPRVLRNEAQLRELSRLPDPARQVEVVAELVGESGDGTAPARALRERIDKRLSGRPEKPAKPWTLRQRIDEALSILDEVNSAVGPAGEEWFKNALGRIRAALDGNPGCDATAEVTDAAVERGGQADAA